MSNVKLSLLIVSILTLNTASASTVCSDELMQIEKYLNAKSNNGSNSGGGFPMPGEGFPMPGEGFPFPGSGFPVEVSVDFPAITDSCYDGNSQYFKAAAKAFSKKIPSLYQKLEKIEIDTNQLRIQVVKDLDSIKSETLRKKTNGTWDANAKAEVLMQIARLRMIIGSEVRNLGNGLVAFNGVGFLLGKMLSYSTGKNLAYVKEELGLNSLEEAKELVEHIQTYGISILNKAVEYDRSVQIINKFSSELNAFESEL